MNANVIVSWRDFAGTRKASARGSDRCCLVCLTMQGTLQHVGVCASFTDQKRIELVEFLKPYRKNALGVSSVERVGHRRRR